MTKTIIKDWLSIITKCRKSGLSDRQWCTEHDVSYSTFYYHVRRLRKEDCKLPISAGKCTVPMAQEVVPLNFQKEVNLPEENTIPVFDSSAITLEMKHCKLHISNHASAMVIQNTLKALQQL